MWKWKWMNPEQQFHVFIDVQYFSTHTTTHVNQCSAGLMSRSCDHKRLLNCSPDTDVNIQWQHIAHSMHTAAGEKIGYRKQQKSTWFDEECRQAAIKKNDAYQATFSCNSSCFREVPREEEMRATLVPQKETWICKNGVWENWDAWQQEWCSEIISED